MRKLLLPLIAAIIAAVSFGAVSGAAGPTIWKGDGSLPLDQSFASVADQEHCAQVTTPSNVPDSRITLVTDLRFAKGKAIRFHGNQGDAGCYGGRSELALGNPTKSGNYPLFEPGTEGCLAWQALFGQTAWSEGGSVIQFHERGGPGTPPFAMGSHAGHIEIYRKKILGAGTGSAIERLAVASDEAERVYNFTACERFSEGGDGYVRVYMNGSRVYSYTGQFGFTSGYQPTHLRVGLYPGANKPVFDEWVGGMTWAPGPESTSRATAEANAFGSAEPPPKEEEPPTTDPDKAQDEAAEAAAAKVVADAQSSLSADRAKVTADESHVANAEASRAAMQAER